MKIFALTIVSSLLLSLGVSAQVLVPFTQVYRVESGKTTPGQGGNEIGNSGSPAAADQDIFFVSFELPDLGGQPLADVNLNLDINATASGYNADLYAIRLTSSSGDVTNANPNPDHQTGSNSLTWDNSAFAPTPASIKIQDNFLTPSTSTGLVSLDATGQSNLLSYLNTNYQSGGYVYFALAADATGVGANFNRYRATGSSHQLSLTIVPEPTSLGLLAIGLAACGLALPRQRKPAVC